MSRQGRGKWFAQELLQFLVADAFNIGVGEVMREAGLNLTKDLGTNLVSGSTMGAGLQGVTLVGALKLVMLSFDFLKGQTDKDLHEAVAKVNEHADTDGQLTVAQLKQVVARQQMLVKLADCQAKGLDVKKKFDDAVDPAKFAKRFGMSTELAQQLLDTSLGPKLARGIVTYGVLPLAMAGLAASGMAQATALSTFLVKHAAIKGSVEGAAAYIASRLTEEAVQGAQNAGVFTKMGGAIGGCFAKVDCRKAKAEVETALLGDDVESVIKFSS
jgi:hypothetical protein